AAAIGRSGFIPFDEKKGCFAESFTRNFIAINLSQYPQTLIESELFGHRKGSFTGAIEHHDGVFSRCSPHGAIFLDEVGDVPETIQIKLLQVLQERTFVVVGSHEKNRFRGRVIAATNKPLADLRRTGRFREDFYYRLCSDVLEVPPLRQRLAEEPAEMDDLLSLLLRRMFQEPPRDLLSEVRRTIERDLGRAYPWTGNVRELEQAVRRIILTGCYPGDARANGEDLLGRLIEGVQAESLDAQQLLASYCRLLHQKHGTYEEVARRTGLDRRTAKRYVQMAEDPTIEA
ncbi:MAG: sigma-54-dependent Fis family transcriptional regulator, partial [Deltaproteobacteria bacterium]|nr:sigma-54-dependent Fis family transcriptional regulator [Deltaproteobacteria bacterium]